MKNINKEDVARHYSPGTLLSSIMKGAEALGKSPDQLTLDDLAPVDEFHIGGRIASRELLDQINLTSDDRVVDFGCGLGGTSRFIADTYGSQVAGIDLTAEFIETGRAICDWVGLSDRVELQQGDALNTDLDAGAYDAASMLHVGMNISDKSALFSEVARVLRPGGRFALYDILINTDQGLDYPVPWAASADTCAAATQETYQSALADAGFEIKTVRDQTHFAGEFFARLKKAAQASNGPPPIGLHLVLGANTAEKVGNMISNVADGRISPTEFIATKM